MRPFIEKLTTEDQGSFVARTFTTPHFEVPWHQHEEFELILFLEGHGRSFIGNYVGDFQTGDIFFIGSNLPHTFQKSSIELITTALVIQFNKNLWGDQFLSIPECSSLITLFQRSQKGFRVDALTCEMLAKKMLLIENSFGFERLQLLFECLGLLARSTGLEELSSHQAATFNSRKQDRIDTVFRFTVERFQEAVTLPEVAAAAGMSVPAFCNYFRKTTKKTYIDFLHEIRIGYACRQLIDTGKSVQEICFESGFNTLANFNKQFMKLKLMTPTAYRRNFTMGLLAIPASNTQQRTLVKVEPTRSLL